MAAPPAQPVTQGQRQHRRWTRRVVLPLIVGVHLLLAAIVAGLLLLPGAASPLQVGAVANTLLLVAVLCPAALCALPLWLLLFLGMVYTQKLHRNAARPLVALERMALTINGRTRTATDRLGHRVINMRARLAPYERLLEVFDAPPTSGPNRDDDNKDSQRGQ